MTADKQPVHVTSSKSSSVWRSRSASHCLSACFCSDRLCEQKIGNFLPGLCFVLFVMFVPAVPIVRGRGQKSSPVAMLFIINLFNSRHCLSCCSFHSNQSIYLLCPTLHSPFIFFVPLYPVHLSSFSHSTQSVCPLCPTLPSPSSCLLYLDDVWSCLPHRSPGGGAGHGAGLQRQGHALPHPFAGSRLADELGNRQR